MKAIGKVSCFVALGAAGVLAHFLFPALEQYKTVMLLMLAAWGAGFGYGFIKGVESERLFPEAE